MWPFNRLILAHFHVGLPFSNIATVIAFCFSFFFVFFFFFFFFFFFSYIVKGPSECQWMAKSYLIAILYTFSKSIKDAKNNGSLYTYTFMLHSHKDKNKSTYNGLVQIYTGSQCIFTASATTK